MKKLFAVLFLMLAVFSVSAQDQKEPVEISGLVMTADSVPQFIPYAHVLVKSRKLGTMTSREGFFSFAAMPDDTITISAIGFKTETLWVPDTLGEKGYLARVVMRRDTTMLEEVTLYPWPSPENFKREFLATNVPTTKEDIAMRNLAIQELKSRAAEMGYGAEEIQEYAMLVQQQNIYDYGRDQIYSDGGTAILGRLSDPFAWARFIKSLSKNSDD